MPPLSLPHLFNGFILTGLEKPPPVKLPLTKIDMLISSLLVSV